jgi:hypothetical protein
MVTSDQKPPIHLQISLPVTFQIALTALFAALGVVLRQISVPTPLPYVTLTPGFTMPLLAGIVLGPIGGMVCGAIVGLSAGLWEPLIIPLIGNIALGLSTGIPSLLRYQIPTALWRGFCIIGGILIGGFLPTFIGELVLLVPPLIAAAAASIDAIQAGIWASVAIILDAFTIQPFLTRNLPSSSQAISN